VTRENSSSTNVSPCQTLLVYLPASHLLVSPFFMPVYCTGFLHISSQTNLPHPHTQLEELNVCGKSNLLRLYVKKLTTVQFVAVKMVYRNVLESTSIFQCPICIYTYHSCMHKCNPTIHFYSSLLISSSYLHLFLFMLPIKEKSVKVMSIQHVNNHCPPTLTFVLPLSKFLPKNSLPAVTNRSSYSQ
jgi:hypothetical protein